MRNKRNKNRKISADSSLRTRFLVLILIFLLLTGAIITRLFDLQIMKGESYENDFTLSIEKKRVLKSTRGEIFDCNGNTLAYNELTYDVTFEDKGSYESNRQRNLALNSILYTAITRAKELLIIVGRPETVAAMTENAKVGRRYTGLKLRLQGD